MMALCTGGRDVRGSEGVGMSEARGAESWVEVRNRQGGGKCLIVCEHASRHIPAEYGNLGLAADALSSHIAWDPGAIEVAAALSALIDAPLVAQGASRLLYDCNRPPHEPSAIPAVSEVFRIPGNEGLSDADKRERAQRFYFPFRAALAAEIAARPQAPVLVTVHSFTPVYNGVARDVEIGILHDADARLADAVLAAAGDGGGFVVRRNEPYGPQDGVTHTLREHALPRGLLNVMIEIRNDLIDRPESRDAIAARLAAWLNAALEPAA
jgi:predicted N-formylglutamate amidohydrolase